MKYLLSLAVLAATCTSLAQGPSEAILGYEASGVIGYAATVGWTFHSTNANAVTWLGCFAKVFEDNPQVNSVEVGLWSDSGLLLASNSITPASILFDQTYYESIIPVWLAAGQVYHLGAYYSGGGIGWDVAGPWIGGSVSASPEIQVDGMAFTTNGFSYPPAMSGTSNSIYAGPNFRFQSRPTLNIQHWPTNQVRLSWYTAFTNYSLQSEPALSGSWGDAGLPVSTVGSEYVAFDTNRPGPKYYRLIK
jgi:hypothetical protein